MYRGYKNSLPSLPRAPPLGKISPGRGKMAKPKRGTAGASAPERASPTEEKEKHSDTRTLTNRVSIAVFICSWETSLPSQSRVARQPFPFRHLRATSPGRGSLSYQGSPWQREFVCYKRMTICKNFPVCQSLPY